MAAIDECVDLFSESDITGVSIAEVGSEEEINSDKDVVTALGSENMYNFVKRFISNCYGPHEIENRKKKCLHDEREYLNCNKQFQ